MHNKVSSNKAFLLSHHCFSAVFSAAGGVGSCRVSVALKGNQEESGRGRKCGSVGELQVGVRVFDVLVSPWCLSEDDRLP